MMMMVVDIIMKVNNNVKKEIKKDIWVFILYMLKNKKYFCIYLLKMMICGIYYSYGDESSGNSGCGGCSGCCECSG